jgi:hypothetical protein
MFWYCQNSVSFCNLPAVFSLVTIPRPSRIHRISGGALLFGSPLKERDSLNEEDRPEFRQNEVVLSMESTEP